MFSSKLLQKLQSEMVMDNPLSYLWINRKSYIKERERVDLQHPQFTTVCATVEEAVKTDDTASYDF